MVNPGTFRGLRKEFLEGEIPAYEASLIEGHSAEVMLLIQRHFFKRFPPEFPLNVEPPEEHLQAVNDDTPDPDPVWPDEDKMTPEEYKEATEKIEARREKIIKLRVVKRWFQYRTKDDKSKNAGPVPFADLMQQLSGKDCTKPRRKTGVNLWRKTVHGEIEDRLMARVPVVKSKDIAKTHEAIAREMFAELDEKEKMRWNQKGMDDKKAEVAVWEAEMIAQALTEPVDRQWAIQALVGLVQPILDAISESTSWKATLIAGGPEPAQDGTLSIISVHSGTTSGAVPMNFGAAERLRYKKFVVPIFGSFLQKCYTPEQCKARALPKDKDYMSLMSTSDFNKEGPTYDALNTPNTSSEVQLPSDSSHALPRASTFSAPVVTQMPATPTVPAPCNQDVLPTSNVSAEESPAEDDTNPFPYVFPPDFEIANSPLNSPQPSARVSERGISKLPSAPPSPINSPRRPTPPPLSTTLPLPPNAPSLVPLSLAAFEAVVMAATGNAAEVSDTPPKPAKKRAPAKRKPAKSGPAKPKKKSAATKNIAPLKGKPLKKGKGAITSPVEIQVSTEARVVSDTKGGKRAAVEPAIPEEVIGDDENERPLKRKRTVRVCTS